MKIRDLAAHPQEEITGFYLVHQRDMRSNKSGENYLSLIVGDDTGSIDARVWDNLETIPDFAAGAVVKVKDAFNSIAKLHTQLSVMQSSHRARRRSIARGLPAEERARDPEEMWQEFARACDERTTDTTFGAGCSTPSLATQRLRRDSSAPAAKSMHHAFVRRAAGTCAVAVRHVRAGGVVLPDRSKVATCC